MIRRQFKADIGRWPRQVCFVPRSGSCTASEQQLFDHSVSCGKQRRRDGQTKCLGRLKIKLEEARQLALRLGQASAAVAATMGKAKILGLIIDRREVGDVGAFDDFTDEQLVEEAARRARELGIGGPRLVEDDKKKPR